MQRLTRAFAVLLASGTIATFGMAPARATYPGGNGGIAYLTNRGAVRAVQPDGNGDHPLRVVSRTDAFAYSADGTMAVVAESLPNVTRVTDRLVLIDLGTGDRSLILSPADLPRHAVYSASMSPDASTVVFCAGFPRRNLYTVGVDGSALTKLRGSKNYCYADWGVDDRIVATRGIFHGDGERLVTTMDPDGSHQETIATFPAAKNRWRTIYILVPSWAPDGSSVVFTAQRNRLHPDIWAVDATGANLRKLTDTKARSESGPVYAPDGSLVVYTISGDLWLMGADSSNPTQLTDTPRDEYSVAWRAT